MSTLDQQVGRVCRRLAMNVFWERLTLGLLIGAAAWSLVLIVERLFVLGIPLWGGLVGAGGLALAIALLGTLLARVSPLRAAVAIDVAAGLKERVSTALIARGSSDPFARAVVRDAEKIAGGIHVPSHLPYRTPRLWPWTLSAVLAGLLVGLFFPKVDLLAERTPANEDDLLAAEEQRAQIELAVNERLQNLKELAQRSENFDALAAALKPLELPEDATKTPEDVRREALKQIDNVAERLDAQRNATEFDALEQMKRMMANLNRQSGNDPAAKLSDALARGKFDEAKEALDELKQKLTEAAKSDDAAQRAQAAELAQKVEELSKQLAQQPPTQMMERELEKKCGMSAEDAKRLMEQAAKMAAQMDPKELQKALQQKLAEKGLDQKQAEQLAKKMMASQAACKQCQGLGKSLQAAAQAMQQCQQPGQQSQPGQPNSAQALAEQAAQALAQAGEQMSDLEMAEQMLEELETNLADLKEMGDQLGDEDFELQGERTKPGDRVGEQGPQYGLGYGAKTGKERAAHDYKSSKEGSAQHPGLIIGQMLVDGPQAQGETTAEVKEAVSAAVRDAEDAIERAHVPRQYQRALREYFERLAGVAGEAKRSAEPAAEKAAGPEGEKAAEE